MLELADFRQMNKIRQRVDDTVADADTAEALKPCYRQFCKRPTFNDEFLPCFNRRQRHAGRRQRGPGRRADHRRGVVANGVEYEVDCIIYASGFEISGDFRRRLGFEINGRDGLSLFDH